MMKKPLFFLLITVLVSCKKDADRTLVDKNWVIASATITPAVTVGSKTTTDLLEIAGPGSCEATTILTFSKDGIFTSGANGALCDLFVNPNASAVTWRRDGNQIYLSSAPKDPIIQNGNTLTQTIKNAQTNGDTYTVVRVFKAKDR
jgi:hypothetical protein